MMRLGRRASLLVALSLLTSAATAYADCAWVLWSEQSVMAENMPVRNIVPQAAFKDQDECGQGREEQIQKMDFSQLFPTAKVFKTTDSVMIVGSKGVITYTYRCFPDTVDPRGPKGK